MKRGSLLLGLLAAVVSAPPAFAATARRYALHGAEAQPSRCRPTCSC
jgi:hypothetical protein